MKELQLMKHQSLQSYELAIPRKHVQILCAVPAICGDRGRLNVIIFCPN